MKFVAGQKITEYHAHVYFQDSTKASAEALHAKLAELFAGKIHQYTIAYGPRGPHVQNMFGLDIPKDFIEPVLAFLILNHGPHAILIHPVSGNELLDHTHHALWLGEKQALNLGVLV